MAEPRLEDGERVIFTAHPGSWMLMGLYFWTLGLYSFWRRAKYFMVTDHRVILSKGLVSKTQRNVPLEMIQDAALGTVFGVGSVVLSSAGGPLSVQKLGPMTANTAREMIDVVLKERKQARQTATSAPVGTPEGPDVMAQLKQLSELRDSGVISAEEFESKKSELLGRI